LVPASRGVKFFPEELKKAAMRGGTTSRPLKKLRKKIALASPGEELIHSLFGVGCKFEHPQG
jgi:hypothetical protein